MTQINFQYRTELVHHYKCTCKVTCIEDPVTSLKLKYRSFLKLNIEVMISVIEIFNIVECSEAHKSHYLQLK